MNAPYDVERDMTRWMAEVVPTRAPDNLAPSIVARTRSMRPRPGWLARLLDRILGAVRISKDERRDAVQPIGGRLRQDGEGGVIALTSAFDERSIHPHRPFGAALFAALTD